MKSFNEQVYALVRHIPRGKVLTYGQIAALLGNPMGARAVGWALNSLRDGTDVPWQRVVNASGQISLRGDTGVQIQRSLLEAEGLQFDEQDERKLRDFKQALWRPSPFEIRTLVDSDVSDDPDAPLH
jgi:methylated-DNA-protein-cysteine methyltransferase-like protein